MKRLAILACLLAGCGGGASDLAAVVVPLTFPLSISWTVPAKNTDGSTLTDIAGYRVAFGISPTALNQTVNAGPTATGITLSGLAAGTYYVTVAVVNSTGQISVPTGPVTAKVP